MKGSVRESIPAPAPQESPDAEATGTYSNGRRSYDLPPLSTYHLGDAAPRNTRSVDIHRGYPPAQQGESLDCTPRPLSFPAGPPVISVGPHIGSLQSGVQSAHVPYRAGSICSSGEWHGAGAGIPDMGSMCLKDRLMSPIHGHQSEGDARAQSRDASEPGVQTPPQKGEVRTAPACRVGTASNNGFVSRPSGLSHPPASSRRQSKPLQHHGMGHLMGSTSKPLITSDQFISPFASMSMNRVNSSSSFGVPTPDKGGSRRTSFE